MTIAKKLKKIQNELQVPKKNWNAYSKFYYRSCEDILEAVKPLLREHSLTMVINDKIKNIGNRYYIEAVVTLIDENDKEFSVTAYARESEVKKGMDESQITGASSSYARKYALGGMFLIDDSRDADTQDNTKNNTQTTQKNLSVNDIVTKVREAKGENDQEKIDKINKLVKEIEPQLNEAQKKVIKMAYED